MRIEATMPIERKKKYVVVCSTSLALILAIVFLVFPEQQKPIQFPTIPKNEIFNPDFDPSAIPYDRLEKKLGKVPATSKKYKMAAILKYLGNQYWILLARGIQSEALKHNIDITIVAGASETDPEEQLNVMENLLHQDFDCFFVSPQTNENLMPAIKKARKRGILIINVEDAVIPDAEFFVGPNQYENGIHVANYLIERHGSGKVALIRGLEKSYCANQRSQGFIDTIKQSELELVANRYADWDLQKALNISEEVFDEHPDIVGVYCNNDIMALGSVEAAKRMNLIEKIDIFGTDGIEPAYESIEAGELRGTIDSYPFETGQISVKVAIRILERQLLPRVIISPQKRITQKDLRND